MSKELIDRPIKVLPAWDRLINGLVSVSEQYYDGQMALTDFADWLPGSFPRDDRLVNREARRGAGAFELLVTEVIEEMRPELELRQEVGKLLFSLFGPVRRRQIRTPV
ncbi:MAG: hypothetical protein HY673_15685 [Chloroflexi bacterium]|nr:hypothetical protein [Chloroflexota bacterium]